MSPAGATGGWPGVAGPLVDAERRLSSLARWLPAVAAITAVLSGAMFLAYADAYASLIHWFRLAWDAAQTRSVAPPVPTLPATPATVGELAGLVQVAVDVLFLVWQHRAASAARWLGLPARHTPAWGVAFWFIPVADLWCPYQALRDCLPPGHPDRRLALWCWLAYLCSIGAAVGLELVGPFSRPAGIVLLGAVAALWLAVAALGHRLIRSTGAAHRALAGG
ncbi:MAG: DUF4328 domain-containing protein [Acidimicrobiales bacterium]